MIQITNISLPYNHNEEDLNISVGEILGIKDIKSDRVFIIRRSLDARKKNSIKRVYTVYVDVDTERDILAKNKKNKQISKAKPQDYIMPALLQTAPGIRPVVIGTGPAGLFAGLILAEAGLEPVLLDRGKTVRERVIDTYEFWKTGALDPESNVQFGEGGAGTFSDGKLQTRVKDKRNRDKKILSELINAGAPDNILYDNKPHLGTARMVNLVENLREKIISLGGEFRFQNRVDDPVLREDQISGVVINQKEILNCNILVLAIGHSARDTFFMLEKNRVALEPKPFSVGFRIEHPQDMINRIQYGKAAAEPGLGAADYQLAYHSAAGRTVYSFCMCPGGMVIAAASEFGGLVTNGMSQFARDETNANSAIVAEVYPADFGSTALGGIQFQRQWEQKAFKLGGRDFKAPCQLLIDFMENRDTRSLGEIIPSYRPGIVLSNLRDCLPEYITAVLQEALPEFEKRIKGFSRPDAVLTGVETRTSSPIRILRGADFQSISIKGLYPAGEGSGYAGGILSSAMDGIKTAEAIIEAINLS